MSRKEQTVRYPPHPCVANAVALSTNIATTCFKLSLLTGQLILALSLFMSDESREESNSTIHLVISVRCCQNGCFHNYAKCPSTSSTKGEEKVPVLASISSAQYSIRGYDLVLKLREGNRDIMPSNS